MTYSLFGIKDNKSQKQSITYDKIGQVIGKSSYEDNVLTDSATDSYDAFRRKMRTLRGGLILADLNRKYAIFLYFTLNLMAFK